MNYKRVILLPHELDLDVKYAERTNAQDAGAVWRPEKRCWVCPVGINVLHMREWWPHMYFGMREAMQYEHGGRLYQSHLYYKVGIFYPLPDVPSDFFNTAHTWKAAK